MIPDQIFARDTEIHWVPIVERVSHLLKLSLSYTWAFSRIEWLFQEDVIECFDTHCASWNTRWTRLRSLQVTTLEQVCNGVIRLVNCGVRERLNHELFVPGNTCS